MNKSKKTVKYMELILSDYDSKFPKSKRNSTHSVSTYLEKKTYDTSSMYNKTTTEAHSQFIPFLQERDKLGRIIYPNQGTSTLMT